jgi:uncharacterized protein YjbI with pentapeptide repeats
MSLNDFINLCITNGMLVIIGFFILTAIMIILYHKGLEEIPRGLKLLFIVFFEILLLCNFWNYIEDFISDDKRVEWLKGLLPILVAAIPAYLIWSWRDTNRLQELAHQADELELKENNDAWENFIKFQKIAEDKKCEHSAGTRATAIFALGEYYDREGTKFPRQVHAFFKNFLDEFWDKQEAYHDFLGNYKYYDDILVKSIHGLGNTPWGEIAIERKKYLTCIEKLEEVNIPEYIKAVHEVIADKSYNEINGKNIFHKMNNLSLERFNLSFANLRQINLNKARLYEVNLVGADLSSASFRKAELVHSNLTHANLLGSDLSGAVLQHANFSRTCLVSANLSNTNSIGIDIYGVNLMNANLFGAFMPYANLSYSNIHVANLNCSYLEKADLSHSNIDETKLYYSNLKRVNLSGTNIGKDYLYNYNILHIFILKLKILFNNKCQKAMEEIVYDSMTKYGEINTLNIFKDKLKFFFCNWKFKPNFRRAIYTNSTQLPADFTPTKYKMINIDMVKSKSKD